MFETWDQTRIQGVGLGAILTVQAGTYDASGNPKTSFAPGETIYFRAKGEPDAGVLVAWSRDGIEQQSLGWEGVNTNSTGVAEWTRIAGASGIGSGSFKYQIVIPVMGVSPDPQAVLSFTVGATSTSGSGGGGSSSGRGAEGDGRTSTTRTQPICIAPAYYDSLLGVCVTPGAATNSSQTQQQTNTTNSGGGGSSANACTPYGLEMAPDGRCIVPRTTSERYTGSNTQQLAEMQAASLARQVRELEEKLKNLQGGGAGTTTPDATAITALQNQIATLTAQLAAMQAIARGNSGGNDDSGGELPTWLQGEWFGLPKPLVLVGGFLAVFMLKK